MMTRHHGPAMVLLYVILAAFSMSWLSGCGGSGSSGGGAGSTSLFPGSGITNVTNPQGGAILTAGQDVIIRGTGFGAARSSHGGGASVVSFNPRSSGASPVSAASYALWSDTQIQCTLPTDGVVTDTYLVHVDLMKVEGPATLLAPEWSNVVSSETPVITSITPQWVNQGGQISIFGDVFGPEIDDTYESAQNGGYVMFGANPGGVRQDVASIWTRTMVICNVPPTVPTGQVQVHVVTGVGQTAQGMVNVVGPNVPTLATITPGTVDVGATTPLTLAGTNLGAAQGTGKVTFQAAVGAPVDVTAVTSWSDRQIVCAVPASVTAAVGTVQVTVTTGTGAATNANSLTVDAVGPLLHGPRLGLITQMTATVSWDTRDAEIGQVRWGTTSSYGGSMQEAAPTTTHRLTIDGLSIGTAYHYAVVAGGRTMADHTFTTAPASSASRFTFASMADNRGHSDQADLVSITAGFSNILQQMTQQNPAFALHAGDLFYGNTQYAVTSQLYDTFKNGTDPYCGNLSMMISPGNHEMQGLTDPNGNFVSPLALFNQEFAQPAPLPGYEGTCYSFDWGNSHFVSVDTCHYDPSSPNKGMAYLSDAVISWLESDLRQAQANKVRHIFVYGHANAWSKWHLYYLGSVDQAQRNKFWAALVKYKVDAYICGHEHLFNDQLGTVGVVQWLNGDSGSVTTGSNQFTIWSVNGDSVDAELVNEAGTVVYKRTIQSSQPK